MNLEDPRLKMFWGPQNLSRHLTLSKEKKQQFFLCLTCMISWGSSVGRKSVVLNPTNILSTNCKTELKGKEAMICQPLKCDLLFSFWGALAPESRLTMKTSHDHLFINLMMALIFRTETSIMMFGGDIHSSPILTWPRLDKEQSRILNIRWSIQWGASLDPKSCTVYNVCVLGWFRKEMPPISLNGESVWRPEGRERVRKKEKERERERKKERKRDRERGRKRER